MKYVYLLRDERNQYKVGVAVHLRSRVAGIQTSNPDRIELVAAKLCENARQLESELHKYLIEHHTNGGQEWFALTDSQALEVAVLMNREPVRDWLKKELSVELLLLEAKQERIEMNRMFQQIIGQLRAPSYASALLEDPFFADAAEASVDPVTPRPSMDELIETALQVFRNEGRVSTTLLQRRMSIGYTKAARIVDEMQARGLVSSHNGYSARVLL